MILMGAGTNHWFHSETIYRAFLALLTLTGCQGRNGGGWGHYVGQEKCRPVTGWATLAAASDWSRPPRQMIGAAWFYLHTDQWRYDTLPAEALASPLASGAFDGMTGSDCLAASARMGWMPSYPTFDRNPLDLAEAEDPVAETVRQLRAGELGFAGEDPDAPRNWPRVLNVWRANLLGSSSKGNEYFLKHLLGTHSNLPDDGPRCTPKDVTYREEDVEGKLDLLMSMDFRMTSTTLLSDVVLPAATWYEKHDLSSTDMHPSCTPSPRPWTRPGRPGPTTTRSSRSPAGSASWPARTSGSARTWWRPPCNTTPRAVRWPSPAGSPWTGRRASASRCPAAPCTT